jgi:hypothetical protein
VLLLLALQFLGPERKLSMNLIVMFGFVYAPKTISKITRKESIQNHWQNWKTPPNKMMTKQTLSITFTSEW